MSEFVLTGNGFVPEDNVVLWKKWTRYLTDEEIRTYLYLAELQTAGAPKKDLDSKAVAKKVKVSNFKLTTVILPRLEHLGFLTYYEIVD